MTIQDVLAHEFFTGGVDTSGWSDHVDQLQQHQVEIEAKVDQLSDIVTTHGQTQEDAASETNLAMADLGRNTMAGLLDASDTVVPTSFVASPCKSLTEDVDAAKVPSFLTHLWDTGKKLASKGGLYHLID
ncbi:Aste57867_11251 [Aphanomyces stellatus]|uniref:Aste57867_11251 protein n=1 Tax=Aphanomyces stellatus TaxID=120398 RepID=A0A485KSE4_9STRA|nr:hypothetical protein As57867_011209 [Aphanomyces stellatus]VFT88116.1 Aste57867_11251 [Aphanomyces stellatus]